MPASPAVLLSAAGSNGKPRRHKPTLVQDVDVQFHKQLFPYTEERCTLTQQSAWGEAALNRAVSKRSLFKKRFPNLVARTHIFF